MNESNWQIEHTCPQCGAPVTLSEADRILLCPYCRTRLYLLAGDHFRYYIPSPVPASRETIYIPYWRVKGLSFSIQENGVSHRFVDANMLALNFGGIPSSLGLRPQVFRLKFASPETEGKFLDPQTAALESVKDVVICIPQSFEQISAFSVPTIQSGFPNVFIGDTASVIYSPLYLENNILHDSLLKRPVYTLKKGEMDRLLTSNRQQDWHIAFISTLCPQCGWDLQGEKEALVLICRNCSSAWSCRGNVFEKIDFEVMAGGNGVSHYLPFWKMKIRIEGIKLASYADLIRVGNLPKAMNGAFEEKPLYFWSPAFKVNPALFLRWARQMTIFQPEGETGNVVPDMSLYPVTLPIREAKESIIITLADIISDKQRLYPLLSQLRITLEECILVYHPFMASHNELIHMNMHLSFDKQSLAYGINL